ncbi:acetyl-CoA C-acetyltransferase [Thermobifida cellulosilytica]|jgi:acetyl-CoA acetyltransferases|uniref:Acetyl-CoA acetyltransferase n=1 Tax=Thermobifida cellulosilytica TB100 TaxID=665004 RepID=A0A147KCZ4_THECS|nr:acetyl-CoA C-acetyltransferase [Thermobifida cellulosilytica]KUP95171.1 acetyl-CoA acetyltransferase [Thermobifida cellulosilytica TB100]
MAEAYIVSAVRTPVGRRKGGLSQVHPADLAGHIVKAAVERAGVDPGAVDDVILGCVDQLGAQSTNVARTAWLAAGLPEHVPGTTIDRQCGSSQQAVHFAAQAVMSGTQDLVVAGGVEVMSLVPISSPAIVGAQQGMGAPYNSPGWTARYGDQEVSQFRGAELIAEKWGISRRDMEEYALRSHQRAIAAQEAGAFDEEIVPYASVTADEGPRRDTSLEKMAELKTLTEGGRLTAAVASQISDGAAALLIASEGAVRRHGLTPLARVHAMTVTGADPIMMLSAPIPATRQVLKKAGLELDDIDHYEVNEAFAPVVLAWLKELGVDPARTNPLGGAIALGHPLGATGAKLMATLVHSLRRTGGRYGLQTMCEGGGMANATVVEVL